MIILIAKWNNAAIGQNPNKLQTLGNHHAITGFYLVGKEEEQRGLIAIIRRASAFSISSFTAKRRSVLKLSCANP